MGLGNPGARHARSRHNVGFRVLDRLAPAWEEGPGWRRSRLRLEGRDLALLEPLTFMNRSGDAVAASMEALGVGLPEVLVVHDELDLPLGVLRLKRGGGVAGHRGLASIVARCGGAGFARLRVGIGRPPPGAGSVSAWVLGDFTEREGARLEDVLKDAARALRAVVAEGVELAMNRVNARGAP